MGHGANTVFDMVIASAASTGSSTNLGRCWKRVFLDATGLGANCFLQAAPNVLSQAGTYRTVTWPATSSGSAGTASFTTAISGTVVEVPLGGFQFVRVVSTATVANGATLKLFVSDL